MKDLGVLNRNYIRVVYQALKSFQSHFSRKTEDVFKPVGYMNLPGVQGTDNSVLSSINASLQLLSDLHIRNVRSSAKGGRLAEIHNHACCRFPSRKSCITDWDLISFGLCEMASISFNDCSCEKHTEGKKAKKAMIKKVTGSLFLPGLVLLNVILRPLKNASF